MVFPYKEIPFFFADENVSSRTNEVLKCIEALEEGGQNASLPFLTNTFEEVGYTEACSLTYNHISICCCLSPLFHNHFRQKLKV